jgi:ATP-binding cassette subfamily B multidrug efflux pump
MTTPVATVRAPVTAPSGMKNLWRFIRIYAARYKHWYAGGLVALLATNLLAVAIPRALEAALRAVDPRVSDGSGVGAAVAIMVGAALALVLVRTASRMLVFVPGREAECELRIDYLRTLLAQPPAFFRRMPAGDLLSRGSNDIQFIRALIGFAGLQLLNVVFSVPLNLTMMFSTSAALTVECLIPLLISVFVMWKGTHAMMTAMRRSQEELAALSDEALEIYGGARVVQAFGAEAAMRKRIEDRNARYVEVLLKMARLRSFLLPIVSVVGSITIVVLIWTGGKLVVSGDLHYGAIAAYSAYVTNIVGAFTGLGWVLNVIQRGQVSLDRVFEVLDTPHPEAAQKLAGVQPLPPGPPAIAARSLTFSYPVTGRAPALSGLDLEIPAGALVGVFGPTGSGKSTLIRLLSKLEAADPGQLYIGGVDVDRLDTTSLRDRTAVVSQVSWLFSRSLAENVASGRPGPIEPDGTPKSGSHDAAEIDAALLAAGLGTDLASLPQGKDTPVGDRGVTLSGGQRQRTAIARAFYRAAGGADLLLFDDCLSAVDHETEQRLVESLLRATHDGAGKTAVIVSHRVSVLRRCDRVLVLDEGRLVESGPPDVLASSGGLFAAAVAADAKPVPS